MMNNFFVYVEAFKYLQQEIKNQNIFMVSIHKFFDKKGIKAFQSLFKIELYDECYKLHTYFNWGDCNVSTI